MQQGAAGASTNAPPQPPPPILKNVHEPGARFPDPPGATWHKRANEDKVGPLKQALGRASSEGHAFVAACDRWVPDRGDSSEFKLVKMYASYLDARAFLTNTLLHSTARFLYEVIPLGAPCKLHWDIEWVGGTCDDAGIRIRDLMSAMNKYITAELAINTRFVVLRGTRLAGGGGYKHSYHIICVDVVFESNTHGMKAFVEGFIRIPEYNSFLQVLDGDGTLQKCIVDTGVYNKNRCFRTELSCKLGDKTSTGLQRVRLDRDGTWNEVRNLAVEDYLDAFVTHHADSFDRESIIPDPDTAVASQPDGRAGKKRRCLGPPSGGGGGQQAEGQDGETMARLQELVDAKGGAGCVVVGPLSDSVGASGGGRGFQCRNNGERSCLVTRGAVHVNNNCYLTVDSRGTVRCWCHARECKSVGPVEIGELGDVGSQAPVVNGLGGRVEDDAHKMDVDDTTGIEAEGAKGFHAEGAKHTNAEGAKGIHADSAKHTNAVSTRGNNAERTKHTNAEGSDSESGSQNESEPEGGGDAEGSDSESGSQHESVLQEGGGDAEGSDSKPIKNSRKRKIGAAGGRVKRRSRYLDDEASASDKDEHDSDDDEEDETCGGFVVDDDEDDDDDDDDDREATPSRSASPESGGDDDDDHDHDDLEATPSRNESSGSGDEDHDDDDDREATPSRSASSENGGGGDDDDDDDREATPSRSASSKSGDDDDHDDHDHEAGSEGSDGEGQGNKSSGADDGGSEGSDGGGWSGSNEDGMSLPDSSTRDTADEGETDYANDSGDDDGGNSIQPSLKAYQRFGSSVEASSELMDYNFEADELYDEPRMRRYPMHERATLVQAAMGVGKSEETRRWLLRLCERRRREKLIIVQVTHRLTFSAQEAQKLREGTGLPFVQYNEIADQDISLSDNPFLVIQWEALHRLLKRWDLKDKKLVLLCDEWNSIMRQMESTAGTPGEDMLIFQALVDHCSHSLFLDAYTTVHSIAACQAFFHGQRPYVIVNSFKQHASNGTRVTSYGDFDFLLGRLHACVGGGGRVVVVTDSKKMANETYLGLQHRFPGKRLLLYTGDTDAATKRRDFADVNVSWATADAVVYTSTCEAGISCTIPGFEDVFAFHVGEVVGVQPFLQMVGRNRAVKRLHVYIRESSEEGEVREAPLTREGILNHYRDHHRPFPSHLLSALWVSREGLEITNTPFWAVLFSNTRHRNASRMAFRHNFLELCESSGMLREVDELMIQARDRELGRVVQIMEDEMEEDRARRIAEAWELSLEELKRLMAERGSNQTQREKDSLEKHFLPCTFGVQPGSFDTQFVQTYNKEPVKRAYRSNLQLRRYGPDAPSAIAAMSAEIPQQDDDWFNCQADELLSKLDAEGGLNVGGQERDAVAFGMWDGFSWEAHRGHKAVHDLLGLVTGLPGVHVAGDPRMARVEAKTIRKRLGYPVGPRGGVRSKGSASAEVVERLRVILKEVQEYVPHVRIKPLKGEVKLKRVVCTLDAVLSSMYGCSFARAGEGGSSGYLLQKSELFGEQNEEGEATPLRPKLRAWGWGSQPRAPDDGDAQQA